MKMNEAFPSAFLKSSDVMSLPGGELSVVVESCGMEVVGQGEDSNSLPVLRFVNKSVGLVLNKTNSNTLVAALGNDSEDWTGANIVVYATKVPFKGDMVDGLRVRFPQQPQVKPQSTQPEVVNVDEDVPF